MLQLKNITKQYKTKYNTVDALKGVDLELSETGLVFVLGKSGCGKSTLLNILGGLDSPTSGEMIINGKDISAYSGNEINGYRNYNVGFIFQDYNLIEEYNVSENIELSLNLQGYNSNSERISEMLKKVDLAGFEKRKIKELSGGQQQRVAIARAIAKDSIFILADEPTGNLDSATSEEIFTLLKALSAEKLIIVVSHDRDSAEQYGDRIIELKDGSILSDRTLNASAATAEKETQLSEKDCCDKEFKIKRKNTKGTIKQVFKFASRNMWKRKIRLTAAVILCFVCLTTFALSLSYATYDEYENLGAYLERFNGLAKFIRTDEDNNFIPYSEELLSNGERLLGDNFIPIYSIGHTDFIVPNKDAFDKLNIVNVEEGKPVVYPDADKVVKIGKNATEYSENINGFYLDIQGFIMENKESLDEILNEWSSKLYDYKVMEENDEGLGDKNTFIERYKQNYFNGDSAIVSTEFLNNILPYTKGENSYSFRYKMFKTGPDGGVVNRISKGELFKLDAIKKFAPNDLTLLPGYESITRLEDNQMIISLEQTKFMLSGEYAKSVKDITDEEAISAIESGELKNIEIRLDALRQPYDLNIVGYFKSAHPIFNWKDEYHSSIGNPGIVRHTQAPFIVSDKLWNNNNSLAAKKSGFVINFNNLKMNADILKWLSSDEINSLTEGTPYLGPVADSVYRLEHNKNLVQKVWLYIALGAMAISVIAILNYILGILSDSKRKIGMLRALGMNSANITAIYVIESMLLCVLALVIAAPCIAFLVSGSMMYSFSNFHSFFIDFSYSQFGVLEALSTVGLGLGVGLLGSVIPIAIYTRKTPIQLMRYKK